MKSRRREFLAAAAASTVACGGRPSPWRFLTQEEANTLAAVCSRIIPVDRDPGATEAGVVDFIDRQLAGFYRTHQKTYREGLAGLGSFATLDAEQQTATLKALEKKHSPFFDLVLTHTMQGYYGSHRHGGNRDGVTWKMPLPEMHEGKRVRMSPDPSQALCYQCHASAGSSFQAGSGDDRTGLGVHEGLSCFACHFKHGQQARASCVECHPRLSNCGLDVEKMDTTFFSAKSKHNIHLVKCADCHVKGVPKRRI
jgi:hypothetical protein